MSEYAFSDEEYGNVLDNFVIGCVDVAICFKGKILLVMRTDNPIKDEWWIFGGRMYRNEDLKTSASRGVHRELGMKLPEERYIEIGTYNLKWPLRREKNVLNGCHHLLVAHYAELTDQEYNEVNEYLAKNLIMAKWFDYEEVATGKFLDEMKDISYKSLLLS